MNDSLNTPEPDPQPNAGTPVWDLVIADMRERDNEGRRKYGTPLQAGNGRDPLVDAYQEALDLAVYLRQAIEERERGPVDAAIEEREHTPVDAAIDMAVRFGRFDGDDHKAWVIDQMVRLLAGPRYDLVVADACSGEDGPDTFTWEEGIAVYSFDPTSLGSGAASRRARSEMVAAAKRFLASLDDAVETGS